MADFDALSAFVLAGDARALIPVIPELAATVGFDQHSPHHAYDVFTHTVLVLHAVPEELTLRWAALLHDIGKVPTFTRDANGRGHFYGHAPAGARLADGVLLRLGAPELLRREAVWLIANHMTCLTPEADALRPLVQQFGKEQLLRLCALQEADMACKGAGEDPKTELFTQVRALLAGMEALPVEAVR